MLGGVAVPFERGFVAHSDGDVLIHALCDALLGAAGLGDIGRHYPDTDAEFAGIDSRDLLRRVIVELSTRGWIVTNADTTIIAQAPRLSGFVDQMSGNLAEDMNITTAQVNVKATTTEKLGFTGRGEGVAAEAVVLIQRGTKS